jgi:hypothetical protein
MQRIAKFWTSRSILGAEHVIPAAEGPIWSHRFSSKQIDDIAVNAIDKAYKLPLPIVQIEDAQRIILEHHLEQGVSINLCPDAFVRVRIAVIAYADTLTALQFLPNTNAADIPATAVPMPPAQYIKHEEHVVTQLLSQPMLQAPIVEPAPAGTIAVAPSVERQWTHVQSPTMADPLPKKRPRAKSKQAALPRVIGTSNELQRVIQQKDDDQQRVADDRARANRIATDQASQDLVLHANVEPVIVDLSQEKSRDLGYISVA